VWGRWQDIPLATKDAISGYPPHVDYTLQKGAKTQSHQLFPQTPQHNMKQWL